MIHKICEYSYFIEFRDQHINGTNHIGCERGQQSTGSWWNRGTLRLQKTIKIYIQKMKNLMGMHFLISIKGILK